MFKYSFAKNEKCIFTVDRIFCLLQNINPKCEVLSDIQIK